MTDEMKLLRAFIEAAGYEIEETRKLDSWDDPYIDYKVTKKAKKSRQAKADGYTPEFLDCWCAYPNVANNSKHAAFRAFQQRVNEGVKWEYLLAQTKAYFEYCKATGCKILHASTFYGPDKRYEADFTIPTSVSKLTLRRNNDDLIPFAKENKLPGPNLNEQWPQYRKRLEAEIEKRCG